MEHEIALAAKLKADFRAFCAGAEPTDRLANEFALQIESGGRQASYGRKPGESHTTIAADLMDRL
jgi:hypothetical protein